MENVYSFFYNNETNTYVLFNENENETFNDIKNFVEFLIKKNKQIYLFTLFDNKEIDKFKMDLRLNYRKTKLDNTIGIALKYIKMEITDNKAIFIKNINLFTRKTYYKKDNIYDYVIEIWNDIKILNQTFNKDWFKLTSSSSVMYNEWKKSFNYEELHKGVLNRVDFANISQYMNGSFNYLEYKIMEKPLEDIIEVDKNKFYTSIFRDKPMPIGLPIYKCKMNTCTHKLTLVKAKIDCCIKDGYIPFLRNGITYHYDNFQWSSVLVNELIFTTMETLELAVQYYDIFNLKILETICFESEENLFKNFIEKYIHILETTEIKWLENMIKFEINKINGKAGSGAKDIIEKSKATKKIFTRDGEFAYLPMYIFTIDQAKNDIVKICERYKDNIAYVVSDGIYLHSMKELNDSNIVLDSKKVGAMKIRKYDNGIFYSVGRHIMYDNDGNIIKMAHSGIKGTDIKDKSLDQVKLVIKPKE